MRVRIKQAGAFLLESMDCVPIEKKESDFVTRIDLRVHEYLHRELPKLIPGSVVISEEDQIERTIPEGYCWMIDPVDGTTNIVYDLRHSCISIGLLKDGVVQEGAIYNPYLGELFYAKKGAGSWLNNQRIHVCQTQTLAQGLIGFEAGPASKHHGQAMIRLMDACYQRTNGIRMLGSSAIDLAYVACGRFTAAYFDYLYPWDYAAGKLLVEEAGGQFTDLHGNPPTFISKSSFAASNALCHQCFLEQIRIAQGK